MQVKMYAHDVKMSTWNDCSVPYRHCRSAWAEKWQLAVSVDKCCVLNIDAENSPPHFVLKTCVLPVTWVLL